MPTSSGAGASSESKTRPSRSCSPSTSRSPSAELHARQRKSASPSTRLAVTLEHHPRRRARRATPRASSSPSTPPPRACSSCGKKSLRGAAYLDGLAPLRPLAALVGVSARLDGAVVRLGHGSFVVTARPISSGEDEDRGFVATLVELDRAQKIAQRLSATRARYSFNDVAGKSPSLQAAVAMARRAAAADANVLLTGESGTGKEVLAQAIHTAGPRANEPFVGVGTARPSRASCSRPSSSATRRAPSPAHASRATLASSSSRPAAPSSSTRSATCRSTCRPSSCASSRSASSPASAAAPRSSSRRASSPPPTTRDLAQLVDEGKFRMDLLYRLRVLAIELPPLRDRQEDIAQLAHHFLTRFAEQQRKRVRELGPRVLDELGRYDWPGNVRELANVMEAEVSLAPPDVDVLDRLATRLVGRFRTAASTGNTGEWRVVPTSPAEQAVLPLAEVEKRAILLAIDRSGGSVSRAAEALGVSKVTVYAKLRSRGGCAPARPQRGDRDEGARRAARWTMSRIPVVLDGRRRPAASAPPRRKPLAGGRSGARPSTSPSVRSADLLAQISLFQGLAGEDREGARAAKRPEKSFKAGDASSFSQVGGQKGSSMYIVPIGGGADLPAERRQEPAPRRLERPADGRVLRRARHLRRQAPERQRARPGRHGAPRAHARAARRAPRSLQDCGHDHPRRDGRASAASGVETNTLL